MLQRAREGAVDGARCAPYLLPAAPASEIDCEEVRATSNAALAIVNHALILSRNALRSFRARCFINASAPGVSELYASRG